MKVGHNIASERANWSFSGDVADTFVDHITKSVPFYAQGHELVYQLSDFFVHDDSACYEIGTSTGELMGKLATHNAHKKNIKWTGMDVEPPMVEKAKQLYMEYKVSQSFGEAEIVNKLRSLKSVLEPFSTQGNFDLLSRAGFKDMTTVFKYICFEGFFAVK